MKKGNVEMLQAQRAIACLEAAMDKLHVLSLMRADGTSVMLPSQLAKEFLNFHIKNDSHSLMLYWPSAPAHDFVQNRQEDSSDLLKMRSDETGRLLEQHDSLMSQFKDKIDTRRFNLGLPSQNNFFV